MIQLDVVSDDIHVLQRNDAQSTQPKNRAAVTATASQLLQALLPALPP